VKRAGRDPRFWACVFLAGFLLHFWGEDLARWLIKTLEVIESVYTTYIYPSMEGLLKGIGRSFEGRSIKEYPTDDIILNIILAILFWVLFFLPFACIGTGILLLFSLVLPGVKWVVKGSLRFMHISLTAYLLGLAGLSYLFGRLLYHYFFPWVARRGEPLLAFLMSVVFPVNAQKPAAEGLRGRREVPRPTFSLKEVEMIPEPGVVRLNQDWLRKEALKMLSYLNEPEALQKFFHGLRETYQSRQDQKIIEAYQRRMEAMRTYLVSWRDLLRAAKELAREETIDREKTVELAQREWEVRELELAIEKAEKEARLKQLIGEKKTKEEERAERIKREKQEQELKEVKVRGELKLAARIEKDLREIETKFLKDLSQEDKEEVMQRLRQVAYQLLREG